jgi:hypothetical protein
MSIQQLLALAAQNHKKAIKLAEDERVLLINLLKEKGASELEYGEEIEVDDVRLVRRVTGAVGVYFS